MPAGVLSIDVATGRARWQGRVIGLSRQQAALLTALAKAGDRVVARTELARELGLATTSAHRVDALLAELRRSLGEAAFKNVRRRGWALEVPVSLRTGG